MGIAAEAEAHPAKPKWECKKVHLRCNAAIRLSSHETNGYPIPRTTSDDLVGEYFRTVLVRTVLVRTVLGAARCAKKFLQTSWKSSNYWWEAADYIGVEVVGKEQRLG